MVQQQVSTGTAGLGGLGGGVTAAAVPGLLKEYLGCPAPFPCEVPGTFPSDGWTFTWGIGQGLVIMPSIVSSLHGVMYPAFVTSMVPRFAAKHQGPSNAPSCNSVRTHRRLIHPPPPNPCSPNNCPTTLSWPLFSCLPDGDAAAADEAVEEQPAAAAAAAAKPSKKKKDKKDMSSLFAALEGGDEAAAGDDWVQMMLKPCRGGCVCVRVGLILKP